MSEKTQKKNKQWTDGKPFERSRLPKDVVKIEENTYHRALEQSAYSIALNHDEHSWELLNSFSYKK